jgi:putative transcriptional regulator
MGFLPHVVLLRRGHLPVFVEVSMKNRLKAMREEHGYSQEQLGKFLEVSRQTINAIENERYDPSLPLAFKVARLFKVRIEDVFVCEET